MQRRGGGLTADAGRAAGPEKKNRSFAELLQPGIRRVFTLNRSL